MTDFQELVKKRQELTKAKVMLRIIFNILLLIIEAALIMNITFSWFVENKAVETRNMDAYSTYQGVSLYLSASFNSTPPPNYNLEQIIINKYAIPGDIIDFSVFVDLADTNYRKIVVASTGIPIWLDYLDNSAEIKYALKDVDISDTVISIIVDEITSCGAVITAIDRVDGSLEFEIELPNDFYTYGDCICLDFKVYFHDDGGNQNEYMGQVLTIGFKAHAIE